MKKEICNSLLKKTIENLDNDPLGLKLVF